MPSGECEEGSETFAAMRGLLAGLTPIGWQICAWPEYLGQS
jgi:hypothetical protein